MMIGRYTGKNAAGVELGRKLAPLFHLLNAGALAKE